MAAPIRLLDPARIYHVISRGNNGGRIVFDSLDRVAFRDRLDRVAVKYEWELFAWCLMSTHEHFVMRAPEGCISTGMQELNSRHAVATNRRHGRFGHLYQNRFLALDVVTDAHFIASTAYVNRNPVAAFVVEHAADWRDSSYRALLGLDPAPPWLAVDFVLGIFGCSPESSRAALADRVRSGHLPTSEVLDEVRRFEERGSLATPAAAAA